MQDFEVTVKASLLGKFLDPKIKVSAKVVDVYQGEELPSGKKRTTLSFDFTHPDRTLVNHEIELYKILLQERFRQELGAL